MKHASQFRPVRGPRASVLAFWFLLLMPPSGAAWRLAAAFDGRLVLGVPAAVSLATYLACRGDQRRAEAGLRRVPESLLHLGELLGGWPGSFLAQHRFRHKVAKLSYQFPFWSIVLLHEFVAIDVLTDGGLARDAGRLLQAALA